MMNLNCVIVDDEPLAIKVIKNYIAETKGLQLINSFNNAVESVDYIRSNQIDLLFLDINMPLLDGFNLLKSLPEKPLTIITTAHEDFAVQSYELEVLDYLVKPISFHRFIMATNRAFKLKGYQQKMDLAPSNERAYIFIKIDKKKIKKVYLDEVLSIESLRDYIRINTVSNKYIIHQTLSSFTEELPSEKFIRIHRSYTISIDKVETIEGNSIEIAGIRYPIGRSYINEVKSTIFKENDINL
ncbi:response regulator transcription factor [Aquimarina sp. 2201CG5-10]|uniref:LytR/AlgR family response regulator transcription factor n=1 Tax=Aquimarina callyspongiae TaxID=3098150 RepID=UPI002AB5DBAA|nr:response regulator transcription factor [Aquimarina sp. 2201CG5-10]MDY8138387.1 response regulator transcription factor [Aquimarina sp. 2201CG5-10]